MKLGGCLVLGRSLRPPSTPVGPFALPSYTATLSPYCICTSYSSRQPMSKQQATHKTAMMDGSPNLIT